MSVEEARKLYRVIGEDESLQKEFSGLTSEDELADKALQLAEEKNLEVSREDIQTLLEELSEESVELDEEELENVAGGADDPPPCPKMGSY